ncbi:MAG: hypothetical protein WBM04_13690 [Candidatus Korobacteraceae bacterium]
MCQTLSDGTLHLLAIDLPLACVLVTPLLLAANALRKDSNPALIVPAVMLIVLGASSLCVAFLETRFPTEALRAGQAGAEVLNHQHNLVILTISTFVAATLLFATAFLVWRALVNRMQPKSLSVTSVVFGFVYVLCSVWLMIAAHQGARLADHLAGHARP